MSTHVQSGQVRGSGSLAIINLTGLTAGNCVIIGGNIDGSASQFNADDFDTNTWDNTHKSSFFGSTGAQAVSFALNVVGGDTSVVIQFGAVTTYTLFWEERSGIATASAFDDESAGQLNLGSSAPTCGSLTTSGPGTVWGILNALGNANTYAAGSDYTMIEKEESAASGQGGAFEAQNTIAGTYDADFNLGNAFTTFCYAIALLDGSTPPADDLIGASSGRIALGQG